MPATSSLRLGVNRRRLARRLVKLFTAIAVSDAKKMLSAGVYLPILDPDDAELTAHVTAVVQHVQAVIAAR